MSQTVQTHITMLVLNYVLSDTSHHRSHRCRALRLSAPTTIRHVLRQYLVRNIFVTPLGLEPRTPTLHTTIVFTTK